VHYFVYMYTCYLLYLSEGGGLHTCMAWAGRSRRVSDKDK
jgi:hypothetical protein